jgi:hypothetical protein
MSQPTIGISITGFPVIDRKLRDLEPKLARKLVRQSARKAAAPVLATAQARCKRRSGALAKSLKIRALKRTRKAVIGVRVVTGADFFKGEQFCGGQIEYGAPGHKTFGRGLSPLAPYPFMRPAHDENKQTVLAIFRSELTAGVLEASK